MAPQHKTVILLMADDDADDCLLTKEALAESRVINELYIVSDGEQLLDYLFRRNAYADSAGWPRPDLILLDLNMPRKDGREALRDIKADAALRRIPIVVLTTSKAEEDIVRAYDLGVNSYITKPVTFQGLAEIMKTLSIYWFEIVKLPNGL